MTSPVVSIVMPTFNAGAGLEAVLDAITSQDCDVAREIIAIDSGSADGTVERLLRRGAAVHAVAPNEFNHGETRNAALSHARGEFAVLLVQDAVPSSASWLAELLKPLMADGSVAGSFARQVPAPGASRITTYYLSRWVAAAEQSRVVGPVARHVFDAMSPAERHALCAFDNVCSCVRMSVWRRHPFRRTSIAEDLEWARDVLLDGYRLAYAPAAVVRHSHERSAYYELQRTYLVHQRLQELFGLSTIPTLPSLLRAVAATIPENVRVASHDADGGPRALVRGAALGVAMPLGQYLGARAAREGRQFLRTAGV